MKHGKLDGYWLWDEWGNLDFMDAQLKCFAMHNGHNANKKDKEFALFILRQYKAKLNGLKRLCNEIEECWDK